MWGLPRSPPTHLAPNISLSPHLLAKDTQGYLECSARIPTGYPQDTHKIPAGYPQDTLPGYPRHDTPRVPPLDTLQVGSGAGYIKLSFRDVANTVFHSFGQGPPHGRLARIPRISPGYPKDIPRTPQGLSQGHSFISPRPLPARYPTLPVSSRSRPDLTIPHQALTLIQSLVSRFIH